MPKEKHFGVIRKECNGLVKLPCAEKYGLLWVHPNPNGHVDIDLILGDLAAELDSWGLERNVSNSETTYDHSMN